MSQVAKLFGGALRDEADSKRAREESKGSGRGDFRPIRTSEVYAHVCTATRNHRRYPEVPNHTARIARVRGLRWPARPVGSPCG